MPSLYCTRTLFAGRRESNLRFSDQKSKVLHGVFRIKKSGNVLAPDPCWKWIICPDIFISPPPRPHSGLNGRPQSALYIGALILERSFAEFGILHHPPVYEGIFLSHPLRLMTMVTDEWNILGRSFGKKKICSVQFISPSPPPSIRWLLIT